MAKRSRRKTTKKPRAKHTLRVSQTQKKISKQSLQRRKRHKPFNTKLNQIEDNRDKRPNRPLTTMAKPALITYAVTREIRRSKPGYKIGSILPGKYRIKPYSIRTRIQRKFLDQNKTVICWRRKIRRAVLFARKSTGKGSAQKRRIRNQYSDIHCSRR